jgi:preprotein translocase subunit SecA
MVERIKAQVAAEHDEVRELGGLYVVGTELHESRRLDNQVRGRSGRQGDPGESRFYLSLQDEMMRLFKSEWVDRILTVLKVPDDVPIDAKRVSNAIAGAQANIESQNFESRKNVLKYDDVMSRQREVIYAERRRVLEGADLGEQIRGFIDDVISGYVRGATEGYAEDWDLDGLFTALGQLYPMGLTKDGVVKEAGGLEGLSRERLIEDLQKDAQEAYDRREDEMGDEVQRELERRVVLSVLDRKWREHLYEMDYLREGIYLRAYSQRDPLVEYQREGFDMFAAMMDGIKEESVGFLFNLQVEVDEEVEEGEEQAQPVPVAAPQVSAATPQIDFAQAQAHAHAPQIRAKGLDRPSRPQTLSSTAPSEAAEAEVHAEAASSDDPFAGVGRNSLCPCGSGQKFKRCHGAPGGASGHTTRAGG